ncbi:MAG: hypothetical protein HY814_08730 [Candidatus Riflebacteria bacterium]|nr:hypothetical protein [Candidatus Riflebacteria bacterium]
MTLVVFATAVDLIRVQPLFGPLWIVPGSLLGIALAVLKFLGLMRMPGPTEAQMAAGAVYRGHVARLITVALIVLAGACGARSVLVPATYGQYGHWRGASAVAARRVYPPSYQGEAVCGTCHKAHADQKRKDLHGKVECETCHGRGDAHVAAQRAKASAPASGATSAAAAKASLFVPHTKDPCLWCHRRLAARPSVFPQIDPREHYAGLGVKDPDLACSRCHNPHEPLFLDRPLHEARLHPVIQQCRDCHGTPPPAGKARPEDHPVVFECNHCHSEVAADHAKKDHAKLDCGKCHIFHRESAEAGRIVKSRDPRFCLLCHRKNDFRGPGAPPLIAWPDHAEEMGGERDEKQACVSCHLDRLHGTTTELRAAALREKKP